MATSIYGNNWASNGQRRNNTGTSSSNQARGLYANLPTGIYNAGGNATNAYVRDTQGNELVSENLNGLLNSDSAYMQNARQTGLDLANSRGLLNSSIAAGNSQRAAIQAGLPIAQGDATAYGAAAAQNQDALNAILAESMGNASSENVAGIGAAASMYGDDLGLMNSRENRAFTGEQSGLDRSFQDYMSQLQHSQGLDNRAVDYRNNMGMGLLGLSGNLLQGQQSFYNNAGLRAMDNPAIMSNPEGFGNYMNWLSAPFSGYIDNIFASIFGGGAP